MNKLITYKNKIYENATIEKRNEIKINIENFINENFNIDIEEFEY